MKDSVNQREYNKVLPSSEPVMYTPLEQILPTRRPICKFAVQIMQRYIMELTQTGHVPKHLSVHLPQGFRQLSGSRYTLRLLWHSPGQVFVSSLERVVGAG